MKLFSETALSIGKSVTSSFAYLIHFFTFFLVTIIRLPALRIGPVRSLLYRQIYFTGIEAFSKIALIGAFIGVLIVWQVKSTVGSDAVLTGKLLISTVVNGIGPLLAAFLVIIRSSAAVASELGSMSINKEIESIQIMGIEPLEYLILPRIVGITISVVMLTFYLQVVSIGSGILTFSYLLDVSFFKYFKSIFSVLSFKAIVISFIKSFFFGTAISTISCYQGMMVESSIREIPRATVATVMQSVFVLFFLEGLITLSFSQL
ncbi:MAG: ABC transporter permease [Nitrospirae bacterium]|nr:ABC transporter permease [Nitrospirota bacterium]MBF0536128.1 ABC transporter permease [Nitrospirota bacterium]MBF0618420.1 ABC transporter permease [Nitrospirota bacterium]